VTTRSEWLHGQRRPIQSTAKEGEVRLAGRQGWKLNLARFGSHDTAGSGSGR